MIEYGIDEYGKYLLSENVCGLIPARLKKFLLEDEDILVDKKDIEAQKSVKIIIDNIKKFVDDGYSLLLYSNGTGNGKTLSALRIGKAYSDVSFHKFYFVNVPWLIDVAKKAISSGESRLTLNDVERNISKDDLIIFDDIATKGLTDFENDLLYRLINSCKKAIIFTSNVTPDKMSNCLDARLADRVLSGTEIGFNGASFRDRNFFEDIEEIE